MGVQTCFNFGSVISAEAKKLVINLWHRKVAIFIEKIPWKFGMKPWMAEARVRELTSEFSFYFFQKTFQILMIGWLLVACTRFG